MHSDRSQDEWIITLSKNGVMTIAMSPEQAEEIVYRAEETGQPLPVYVRYCFGMSGLPMPKLLEFRKERGTYSSLIDKIAAFGYSLLTISAGKIDGDPEKLVIVLSVDDSGATATIAEKDVPFLEYLFNTTKDAFGFRKARKRRRKQQPLYRFPDTDAGHA